MRKSLLRCSVILLTVSISYLNSFGQNAPAKVIAGIPVNYDEALSGTYTLPDPLVMMNGKKVKNAKAWYNKRRPEILHLFEEFQYGRVPAAPADMTFNVFDKGTPVFDGKAVRKQITVYYGETIDHMTHPTRYFYQFTGNWRNYKDDPSKSPVDAHMLVSLMAPRPLLLQTGDTDGWSDPKGEFLAAVAAEPVYTLLEKNGLGTNTWPAAGQPVLNDLGYYMHEGGHGTLPGDYKIFIEFIKMHFFTHKSPLCVKQSFRGIIFYYKEHYL